MNAATVNPTQIDLSSVGLEGVALETPDHIDMGSAAQGMKGATKGIVWKLKRDQIKVLPGLNVRARTPDYLAHIERISRSMLAEGWLAEHPMGVFVAADGTIYAKDGHTRLEAYDKAVAMGAEIDHVPAICGASNSIADITVGLVKGNEGRPLQPLEKAVVCKRLTGWGWDPEKIASRLDFSVAYVNELLMLLSAPPALVALVEDGTVAASTAVTAIKDMGAAAASEAIQVVVKAKKAAAPKPGKGPAKPVKVVPSDIGQSKAQRALKKAGQGNALKPGEVVRRQPTAKEAIKLLGHVWADAGYDKLSAELKSQIDFFYGKD